MGRFFLLALFTTILNSQTVMACELTVVSQDTGQIELKNTAGITKPLVSVTEDCDVASGYVLAITSANGSKLKSSSAAYDYQIRYAGQGPFSLTMPYEKVNNSPSDHSPKTLEIIIPAYPYPVAGDYSDVISISISAR